MGFALVREVGYGGVVASDLSGSRKVVEVSPALDDEAYGPAGSGLVEFVIVSLCYLCQSSSVRF